MFWDKEWHDSDRESLALFGDVYNTSRAMIAEFMTPHKQITATDAQELAHAAAELRRALAVLKALPRPKGKLYRSVKVDLELALKFSINASDWATKVSVDPGRRGAWGGLGANTVWVVETLKGISPKVDRMNAYIDGTLK